MNKFPFGQNLTLNWHFTTEDGEAFDISGYTPRLFYYSSRGEAEASSVTVETNQLHWTFTAGAQLFSGDYSVKVILTQTGEEDIIITYSKAFSLVDTTRYPNNGATQNSGDYTNATGIVDLFSIYSSGEGGGSLPPQGGNAGKYLQTNGTSASWEEETISAETVVEPAASPTLPFVEYIEQTLTDEQKTQTRTNIGAYAKPATGIPSTDMTSTVQESLSKADAALPAANIVQTTGQNTDKVMSQKTVTDALSSAVGSVTDVTVNGTSVVTNKVAAVSVPTKTSDLTNDSNFITNAVSDLVNYYLKSDTYNKTEVNNLIAAIKQFTYEVVATLPTASASTMNKIYLVPSASSAAQNVKDEFITIENGGVYSWEQIGSTSIDLSNYYTKAQADAAFATAAQGALAATAYQKPASGIPETDLADAAKKVRTAEYGTTTFATMKGWLDNGDVVRCVMGSGSDMIGYVTYYSESKIHFLASSLDTGVSGEIGICVVAKGFDGEADIWTYDTFQPENAGDKVDTIGASPSSAKYPSEYCLAQVAAGKADASAVAAINAKIPSQATSSNQLADKDFVNSSIQTATAEFKGTWKKGEQSNVFKIYIEDGDIASAPFSHTYNVRRAIFADPEGEYDGFTIALAWGGSSTSTMRMTVKGDDTQLYDGTITFEEEAQRTKTVTILGRTYTMYLWYDVDLRFYLSTEIDHVSRFAHYGAWNLGYYSQLTADNNDYLFYADVDSAGNTIYKRYKWNDAWEWEYDLNTTGFTAAQWAAVNSGATASDIAAIAGKYTLPNGGIPSTDLASAVQTSLGKADTALQSVPSTYRTAAQQDVIDEAYHTQATADHTQAGNDHTQAGTDHTASVAATSAANEAAEDLSAYAQNVKQKSLTLDFGENQDSSEFFNMFGALHLKKISVANVTTLYLSIVNGTSRQVITPGTVDIAIGAGDRLIFEIVRTTADTQATVGVLMLEDQFITE